MSKDVHHIVSFSGGKDSTAMLIEMVNRGYHIDEIVFADTQLEFPEMYEYIDRVEDYIGMDITRLRHDKSFDEYFYGTLTRGKFKGRMRGWPPVLYGCYINRDVKVRKMKRYVESREGVIVNYIGFTDEERKRSQSSQFDTTDKHSYVFPLIEWGWTEEYCLEYLESIDMKHPLDGLRSGCWLCPKQPVSALQYIFDNHPDLWVQLLKYEDDAPDVFHPSKCLYTLDERFRNEKNQTYLDEYNDKE